MSQYLAHFTGTGSNMGRLQSLTPMCARYDAMEGAKVVPVLAESGARLKLQENMGRRGTTSAIFSCLCSISRL